MNTPADRDTVRVVVVDDHLAFAEVVGMAIDLEHDLECAGVAATAAEALDMVVRLEPDVVLMDVRLPDIDGVEATVRVRELRPETRVLIVTGETSAGKVARAAAAGASGFLPKESPFAEIIEAIRSSTRGGGFFQSSDLGRILERAGEPGKSHADAAPQLTQRELDVLRLMGEGLDTRTIAKRLGLSVYTCRDHVSSILGKLGAHNQLEAVIKAMRTGLLPGPPV